MTSDKTDLIQDVNNAFRKLSGCLLELSEGFFKENSDQKKWTGYRKLVLDMINAEQRYIVAKLEGKNYYHFVVKGDNKNG